MTLVLVSLRSEFEIGFINVTEPATLSVMKFLTFFVDSVFLSFNRSYFSPIMYNV
jgi:hypothetical protein